MSQKHSIYSCWIGQHPEDPRAFCTGGADCEGQPDSLKTLIAKSIHDGPAAQAQYDAALIARHSWDDCQYKDQYFADAERAIVVLASHEVIHRAGAVIAAHARIGAHECAACGDQKLGTSFANHQWAAVISHLVNGDDS